MTYEMHLDRRPFCQMRSGMKTIELRLDYEERKGLRPGDEIIFISREYASDMIRTEVQKVHRFPTFKELYEKLPLSKCGYSRKDAKTADWHDMEKYYPLEKQQEFGVLGIEIKVLDK